MSLAASLAGDFWGFGLLLNVLGVVLKMDRLMGEQLRVGALPQTRLSTLRVESQYLL